MSSIPASTIGSGRLERYDHGRPYVFTNATEDWRKNRRSSSSTCPADRRRARASAPGHEGLGDRHDDELAALLTAVPRCSRTPGSRVSLPVIGKGLRVRGRCPRFRRLDEACGDRGGVADPGSPATLGGSRALADREEARERRSRPGRRFSWLETGTDSLQATCYSAVMRVAIDVRASFRH